MINELYQLSKAMDQAKITPQNWHRKYKPIPNITAKAPCVKICISDGKVSGFSEVSRELGTELRKYGTNQGSYPCLNMIPLYRVTDEMTKNKISELCKGTLNAEDISKIKSWCVENNWGKKFQNKYKISMENTPKELCELLKAHSYEPLSVLMEETAKYTDPSLLHIDMEEVVFQMLDQRENVKLALTILFHLGNSEKNAEDDTGAISTAFESSRLIDMGIPAVSVRFTEELNAALLQAEAAAQSNKKYDATDAFGIAFETLEEPMPEVKLAGGFDVKLRTMFKEQRCQSRYGRIENASYPISPMMRKKLQSSLNWLGSSENKDITWTNIDKNEILFAFPNQLPEIPFSYTKTFKRSDNQEKTFTTLSKQFVNELKETREPGTDKHAEHIQIFVLKKMDKARTKVIYTRQTDPEELELCSEEWTIGCCENLPTFPFGSPAVPFPIDATDIINRIWKQDGTYLTGDKAKFVSKYHGMELLLEREMSVQRDLHVLVQGAITIGPYLGRLGLDEKQNIIWWKVKDMLSLMGFMLYRSGVRKEKYMEDYPYLYGQLLKVSDELHSLYCYAVRDGQLPPQLAGGSLFQAAADAPIRTLNVLGQRMNPYISWAKTYRTRNITVENAESWKAGWLLGLYEKIATQLYAVWSLSTRLNDVERAQLFIGYLAAFPKKDQSTGIIDDNSTK